LRLTVGSGMRSWRLAAEKLPAATTATNTDIDSRRSMAFGRLSYFEKVPSKDSS